MSQALPSFRRNVVNSSVLNLLPRVGAFVLTVLIGARYGANKSSDIYFYLFSTINLIAIFIRGINGTVLLPEYAHLVEKEGRESGMRFLNFYFWLVVAIGLGISAAFLVAPFRTWGLVSSFPDELLRGNLPALYWAAIGLVPTVALYFLSDVMIANRLFGLPSIAGATPYGLSLGAMALLAKSDEIWVSTLLGCWAAGCLFGAVGLAAVLAKRAQWHLFRMDCRRRLVAEKNIVYAQCGNIFTVLAVQIPAYYLSGLGSGAVSIVSYARTLTAIPRAFFTDHVALVAGISFNEIHAKADFKELNRIFLRCGIVMFLLLFPAVIFAFSYHRELSEIVAVFSNSLGSNTGLVVQIATIMMLALPWQAVDGLSSRLFMAGRAIATSLVIQVVFNIVLVIVTLGFLQRWGAIGYAWAVPLTTVSFTLAFTPVVLRARFPWLGYFELMKRCLFVASMSAALILLLRLSLPHSPAVVPVAGLLYVTGFGLLVVAGIFGAEIASDFRRFWRLIFTPQRARLAPGETK